MTAGYINIDCGGKGGRDPVTGLNWVTDEGFLQSADRLFNERLASPAVVTLNDSTPSSRNNAKQLETAMAFVFPNVSGSANIYSKYCYRFNLSLMTRDDRGATVMVRATFPSTNYSIMDEDMERLKQENPSYASIAVDGTTVADSWSLDSNEPQTLELFFTSYYDDLYFCLHTFDKVIRDKQPTHVGAISSLEVRSIPATAYPVFNDHVKVPKGEALQDTMWEYIYVTSSRFNFGGNESSRAVRYDFHSS